MGFLGAYLLAPVIDRLLIDMPATDPVTFAGTALLLTTTTLMACYLPARRATRVDPIVTLGAVGVRCGADCACFCRGYFGLFGGSRR